ncbi:uncharacterized protein LOC128240026 [Mya arenaria]|uniref:uncharacterized protein LOC128240026 n=1 Tax=Mya arenaria TaxID=6604 RepID=UPI0022E5E2E8|nr:uncharacterized protein LOC128240026 [Mya arenaria]
MDEFATIKSIQGYEAILNTVLKNQIKILVDQLYEQTGEEAFLLTASLKEGTFSYLGSKYGKDFLEKNSKFKTEFFGYCLSEQKKYEDTLPILGKRKLNSTPNKPPVRFKKMKIFSTDPTAQETSMATSTVQSQLQSLSPLKAVPVASGMPQEILTVMPQPDGTYSCVDSFYLENSETGDGMQFLAVPIEEGGDDNENETHDEEQEEIEPFVPLEMEEHMKVYDNVEDVNKAIREYEIQTSSRFSAFSSTKNFGNSALPSGKKKFNYTNSEAPYTILGKKVLYCHLGILKGDRIKGFRSKKKTPKADHDKYAKKDGDDNEGTKTVKERHVGTITEKWGCRARIVIKEVLTFPLIAECEYRAEKKRALQEFKNNMEESGQRKFFTFFPATNSHSEHPNANSERMDPILIKKVEELVKQGITDNDEIKQHLTEFVHATIGPNVPRNNHRFFPLQRILRNHIRRCENQFLGPRPKPVRPQSARVRKRKKQQSSVVDTLAPNVPREQDFLVFMQ